MQRFYLFIIFFFAAVFAKAQWTNAVLDSLTNNNFRDEVKRQSITVDESNTIHVVYMRARPAGGWVIYYRQKPDNLQWNNEILISDSGFAAFTPAIAVDNNSYVPYVVYTQDQGAGLEIFLASDNGGGWISTPVTANNIDDEAPTIAVDENGNVHLAWISLDSLGIYRIFYSTNISGNWDTQILANSNLGQFGTGAYPFIATTKGGTAHIIYRGGGFSNYNIDHAYNAGPGSSLWQYENIITPNSEDYSGVMTIGPDSTINVAITGSGGFGFPNDVYYLYKPEGQQWSFPELINSGFNGEAFSIFSDTSGFVHISINEISGNFYTGNVYYASDLQGGGGWLVAPLLTTNDIYNASIILDNQNDGYMLAFQGTTFETQEIVVYGKTDTVTGINNLIVFDEIMVYPNPVTDVLKIDGNNNNLSIRSIKLQNIRGEEIKINGDNSDRSYMLMDFNFLPAGIYFLQLFVDGYVQNYKLIKK